MASVVLKLVTKMCTRIYVCNIVKKVSKKELHTTWSSDNLLYALLPKFVIENHVTKNEKVLTAKWNSLGDPCSIGAANSSGRAQKLEPSVTCVTGYRALIYRWSAKLYSTVSRSSRKPTTEVIF